MLSPVTGADLRGGWRRCAPPGRPAAFYYNRYSAKKNYVVYCCWSKTWDEVEEFMINGLKMVVWHLIQLRHSLLVYSLLRKILDPPLRHSHFLLLLKGKPASEQALLMIVGYQSRLFSFAGIHESNIYLFSRDISWPSSASFRNHVLCTTFSDVPRTW